jgi:hypothetical protein
MKQKVAIATASQQNAVRRIKTGKVERFIFYLSDKRVLTLLAVPEEVVMDLVSLSNGSVLFQRHFDLSGMFCHSAKRIEEMSGNAGFRNR